MQNTRALHETSDELKHRHPFHPDADLAHEIRPDDVFQAYGDRCLPKLVALLERDDSLPCEKRLLALQYMLEQTRSPESKCTAVASGALPACTQLLSSSSSEVRSMAAKVLASLMAVKVARDEAGASNCVDALVVLLSDPFLEVREVATEGIREYVKNADGATAFADCPGGVSALVKSIPDANKSPVVHRRVLEALQLISSVSRGLEACLEAECQQALVRMASFAPVHQLIAQVAWNLAAWQGGKRDVIGAGLVKVLGKLLADAEEDAHAHAHASSSFRRIVIGALLACSVEKDAKLQLGEEPITRVLCAALQDDCDDVRLNAKEAIVSAAEVPSVRRIYIDLLLLDTDTLEAVFGATSAPYLMELLRQEAQTEDILVASVSCLNSLAQGSQDAAVAIFDTLYSIKTAVHLSEHSNPLIRRHARDLAAVLKSTSSSGL